MRVLHLLLEDIQFDARVKKELSCLASLIGGPLSLSLYIVHHRIILFGLLPTIHLMAILIYF